ncbi:MarR family winged helix-turn-helix transcriptional regulator [Streptomyces anandii]|uniref:MarR family winged helix-turn-helix transcriptional regulator n=1 Tax=Streptomyces anandii TaxID=285454 RepID=UPI00167C00B6|nr:MarR family transcriptional regulator [Streptomyces anandii]GGX75725.1 MarR family transcriptional regulator [Streptomyces anandii JCM 4720]
MSHDDESLPPDELGHRLTEVFDLVGPLYRRVQRAVERGEAVEGLSVGVRAVLDLLHKHGPMTVPQMGRAQAISRQFVQRMVNEAAARDLVEAVPNPAHQRSSLIRLTDAGRAAITAVLAREHAVLREVGGGLTGADVTACLRVLGEMLRLFDHVDVN